MVRYKLLILVCALLSLLPLIGAENKSTEKSDEKEERHFIPSNWDELNILQKTTTVILIPPGFVFGVCYNTISWMFMGQPWEMGRYWK